MHERIAPFIARRKVDSATSRRVFVCGGGRIFHHGYSATDAASEIARVRARYPDYATEARQRELEVAAKAEAAKRLELA